MAWHGRADGKIQALAPTAIILGEQNSYPIRIYPWTGTDRAYGYYLRTTVSSNKTMVLRDLIGDVFRTLWSHKLRTFLTMFGIAWGIVSIVLMVAAGEGLRVGQAKVAETLGKDVMIVFHGRTSLQAGGQRAGRPVQWSDEDVPYLQTTATECQYVLPELEQETVRTHSAYNNAAFPGHRIVARVRLGAHAEPRRRPFLQRQR